MDKYEELREAVLPDRQFDEISHDLLRFVDAASPDTIRELLGERDALWEALQLALEYWSDRQQRYNNRSPAWVQKARAALTQQEQS